MTHELKLSEVESELGELSYPVARRDAAERFDGVTVRFAEGEADLGGLIAETPADSFDSPDELYADLNNVLPVNAVGEPGQSEGDA